MGVAQGSKMRARPARHIPRLHSREFAARDAHEAEHLRVAQVRGRLHADRVNGREGMGSGQAN